MISWPTLAALHLTLAMLASIYPCLTFDK